MKKKIAVKTDALYSAVFRKKMAIEWQEGYKKKEPGNCKKALPSISRWNALIDLYASFRKFKQLGLLEP